MRLYFAGVNQHQWLEAMKGCLVLESFADVRRVTDRYRGTWRGAMLDSGAFTEMSTGKKIDIAAYADFASTHGRFYDAIINLDDIRGDVDQSKKNLSYLKDRGIEAMPVFHQGEPWSVFEELVRDCTYVGVGLQRPIREPEKFLDEVFSRNAFGTRIHGFALTSYAARWPFYSVDSTTWLWEVRAPMGVRTQGNPLEYLTPAELLQIVKKKYDRAPRCMEWDGPMRRGQMSLGLA